VVAHDAARAGRVFREYFKRRKLTQPVADGAVPFFNGVFGSGGTASMPIGFATPYPAPAPQVDIGEQLSQLAGFHAQGALTATEFAAAKAKVLFTTTNGPIAEPIGAAPAATPTVLATAVPTAAMPTVAVPDGPTVTAALASAARAVSAAAAAAMPPPPPPAAVAMPPPLPPPLTLPPPPPAVIAARANTASVAMPAVAGQVHNTKSFEKFE
jgi:hypothetical protein